jgi:hypothetical protein
MSLAASSVRQPTTYNLTVSLGHTFPHVGASAHCSNWSDKVLHVNFCFRKKGSKNMSKTRGLYYKYGTLL